MDREDSSLRKALDPDLVIINGHVITVDDQFTKAEAVAAKDGKILAVGASAQIKELIGQETRVLDLKGKTMLPGIIDHHIHGFIWGINYPPLALDLKPPAVESIADLVALVKKKAEASPPGAGIFGFGVDPEIVAEMKKDGEGQLTKRDLDLISPQNPVCLQDSGRNYLWANSQALALAQITKETPDPPGCRIEREATGEPTGFMEVERFTDFIMIGSLLPLMTIEERRDGLLAIIKILNSYGITSIVEAGLGPGMEYFCRGAQDNVNVRVFSDLHREGRLNIRATILLLSQDFYTPGTANLKDLKKYLDYVATNTGFGDEWLRIGGLKMFADLVHFNKTSWMWEEYVGGGRGSLLMAGETDEERYNELMEMIAYGNRQRYQMGIHVIGDRGCDAVVDGFIKALKEDPWDARHYLIHASYVRPETMKRMAEHNIGASIQVPWKWWWWYSDLDEAAVGPARDAYSMPMRSLLDAGVRVANSSDAPECEPDWKIGVQAAVRRVSKLTGRVSGPEQCVTREEAIRSYTIDAAYLDHQDQIKGSIEVGKLADFCILGDDILAVPAEKIRDVPVLMTIVGGRIVYDAELGDIKMTKGPLGY